MADICALVAPLAIPLLASPVKKNLDAASVQFGAAQLPLRHSGCTYASQASPPGSPSPGGTVTDSITVWLDGAKSPDDAKKELNGLVQGYSSNAPPTPADVPAADIAYLFPGVFLAVRGRLILTVQASSDNTAFETTLKRSALPPSNASASRP